MYKLYLLRHGESQANKDRIFAAKKINPPLTELGIEQITKQAESLKNIRLSSIYASPLLRAQHTANIINKHHGLEIITSDNLYEIDVGILDGDNQEDPDKWAVYTNVMDKWEQGFSDFTFPQGETLNDVKDRWLSFLKTIEGKEGNILIAGHCLLFMAFTWLFCENHNAELRGNYMGRGHLMIVSPNDKGFWIDRFNIPFGEF